MDHTKLSVQSQPTKVSTKLEPLKINTITFFRGVGKYLVFQIIFLKNSKTFTSTGFFENAGKNAYHNYFYMPVSLRSLV